VRLITSTNGKIDSKSDTSELVLENASVTTFSNEKPYKNLFSEKVANLRYVVQTRRGEIINQLGNSEGSPEELGISELAAYSKTKTGKEKIEADILWERRLMLSITPLMFGLLGAALVLRFNRGGKGFGILLALVSLIIYYLLALLGEQLARTGVVDVLIAGLLPVLVTCLAIFWFFLSQRLFLASAAGNLFGKLRGDFPFKLGKKGRGYNLLKLTTGILDFDIISNLLKYFLLTFGFLISIYMIFTALELWRFAGNIDNGINLLIRYLIFLTPIVYIQISPSALMIAVLATYVIKSRQNEIVTWTASGQSIYRLLFPCFILMMLIGFVNWEIQERWLPQANRIKDDLRAEFRSKGVVSTIAGKYWVATDQRIYSFELPDNGEKDKERRQVTNLTIFQFENAGAKLETLYKTDSASWEKGRIKFLGDVEKTTWIDGLPQTELKKASENEITEDYNPFKQTTQKASQLNAEETAEKVKTAESESEQKTLAVALESKYATPFLPLIITLFTAPFALSLSRKGKVATVGYAVGIWLLFTGITTVFEQFGNSGYLSPKVAIWSPLIIFALLGGYLLSKVRT
jgi:lipopolysaccharide export system permease protein